MLVPEFKSIEEVQSFLTYGSGGWDEWCRPMVEEYIELIVPHTPMEEIALDELNGWIENELHSMYQGYEEYATHRSY